VVFRDVVMRAPSLAAQRAFYGAALGLPLVADGPDEVAFRVGSARVAFRAAAPGSEPSYHVAFAVPWSGFAAAKAWLAGRAPLLPGRDGRDEVDWSFWSARAVYALDPAGSVIELIAFDGLDAAAGDPFTGASLLGVAEVGLPVADVRAAVRALRDGLGIDVWEGEEIDPAGITAVGERGATFIVVPLGRAWFPVATPGRDHPLEVALDGVRDGQADLAAHPYAIAGTGVAVGS